MVEPERLRTGFHRLGVVAGVLVAIYVLDAMMRTPHTSTVALVAKLGACAVVGVAAWLLVRAIAWVIGGFRR
jgi:hypothetical protein